LPVVAVVLNGCGERVRVEELGSKRTREKERSLMEIIECGVEHLI
jgi:hypothetical protein